MRRGAVWLLVVAVVVGAAGFGAWRAWSLFTNNWVAERCYIATDGDPLVITHEQAANAAIIVAASYTAGLPEQAAVIALATAWQESGLRNLDYGDRDSLGLFQQRPSFGWGTEAEIMDPWYSSGRFYEELVKFDGWESVDVNDMAQKVQRSGFPEAYRKHETNAIALAGALRGSRPATLACYDKGTDAGSVSALEAFLGVVPGVEASQEGSVITLTGPDDTSLWAATQLILAHSRAGGIQSATVGTWTWTQGPTAKWQQAKEPALEGIAELRLR